METLSQLNLWGLGAYFLVSITVTSAFYYFFVIYYVTQEKPMGATVPPSVTGFFTAYWKMFEAMMIAAVPLLIAIILTGILAIMGMQEVGVALVSVAFIASIYFMLRYKLVMVLATIDPKTSLRFSWRATDKQVLRILGNSIVFFVLISVIMMVAVGLPVGGLSIIINLIAGKMGVGAETTKLILTVISAVIGGISNVISSGLGAAFSVTIAKILTEESRAKLASGD
jgi:hypothetical protein